MRLHRVGAKHQPSYRIVVTPALTPRDGSYLDQVGFYNPRTEPATLRIDNDKVVDWLLKGVQPTDRVTRLLAKVAIDPAAVRRGEPIPAEVPAQPVRKSRAKKADQPEATEAATAADIGEPVTATASEPPPQAGATALEPAETEPPVTAAQTQIAEAEEAAVEPATASGKTAASPEEAVASEAGNAPDGEQDEAKPARKRATRKTAGEDAG